MRTLLVIIVLAFLGAIALPFSEGGSRWILNLVQRFAPVELDYRSGRIASRLELSRIAFVTDRLRVEASAVAAELDAACFWRSVICIADLEVDELIIEIQSGERETENVVRNKSDTVNNRASWDFPLQLEVPVVAVARASVSWDGGEWRQDNAALEELRIDRLGVAIRRAEFLSPELVLHRAEDDSTSSTARVELPEIWLPFRLSVGILSLDDPEWDFFGSKFSHEALSLSGAWQGTALQINELGIRSRELGSLSLAGNVSFSDDWPIIASGSGEVAGQALDIQSPLKELEFEVSGNLAALSVSLQGEGSIAIGLQASSDLLDRGLPFELEAKVVDGSPFQLSTVFELPEEISDLALETPWNIQAGGSLEQQWFQLSGGLSGLGYKYVELVARGERKAESVLIHKLSLVDEEGDSRINATGEALLQDHISLQLSIDSPGFSLPASVAPAAGRLTGEIAANIRMFENRWLLRLDGVALQGEVNGQAAHARGVLSLDQNWSLGDSDLQVVLNGADLRLVGSDDGSRDGRLEIGVEDVGRWQPGMRGSFVGRAKLSPLAQRVEIEGDLQDFNWAQVEVDRTTINGHYFLEDDRFQLSLRGMTAKLGRVEIADLEIAASGDQTRQSLQVTSAGDLRGGLRLEGSGWSESWRGVISPTVLETAHGSWRLEPEVELAWLEGEGQLLATAHCWRKQAASLCIEELRLGTSGAVRLGAKAELANFDALLPPSIELGGTSEIMLAGQWEAGENVLFEGTTKTESVSVTRRYGEGESARVTWDRGDGKLRFDGTLLSVDWSLYRDNDRILDLSANLPVSTEDAIDGQVTLSGLRLEPLIAFAPSLGRLGGELTGQLSISGTRGNPLANGSLRLADGVAALAGNPTELSGLQLSLEFQGEDARIAGRGLLGGGQISVEGDLALQPDWQLQLVIDGERQRVLYPPATELLLSERLNVSASPGLVALEGEVTVHEGKLEPEQLPEGSVAVSAHVVEVDYHGNVIRRQLPFDVSLNVRIRVEDRFEVRSSLLFATLGGELKLLQRPSQPMQLFGTMRVVDGYVSAYKQKLQIQTGVFSFTGRPDNPSVNVRAVRNISGSNVIAGIQVLGTYEALSMNVFSEPSMSDGETMSYLIRGRGLDASAGEDGTALALAVAGGVVNRSTLVSELNRIPGVNNVSFGADGSNDDTAATVSGFIGDRIYLSYGIGVYEPINVLIARFYLRTRLWLEVVSRLENSVDLYYAFDID